MRELREDELDMVSGGLLIESIDRWAFLKTVLESVRQQVNQQLDKTSLELQQGVASS